MAVESVVAGVGPHYHQRRVRLLLEDPGTFSMLQKQIAWPQRVMVAGKLDSIRHSDRTFALRLPATGEIVRGVTDREHLEDLQSLWGQSVLVAGTAHFTASGKVSRIEAHSILSASYRDVQLWGFAPEPLFRSVPAVAYRVPQGPRSGVNAVIGQWPGDESDDEIAEALESLC